MIYSSLELTGSKLSEIDTEIRFFVASERASGAEIVRIYKSTTVSHDDDIKFTAIILRVLRSMKRSGAVSAFAAHSQFASGDTEAEYLMNKYSKLLEIEKDGENSVYVEI